MELLTNIAVITLAGLVHASFQLSVSMITLLSGHHFGTKTNTRRIAALTSSFVGGSLVGTLLVLATVCYVILVKLQFTPLSIIWVVSCSIALGTGICIWALYYRHGSGTSLWLPRTLARYIHDRVRATRLAGEAFGLGVSSVLAEIMFILAPTLIAALIIVQLNSTHQLIALGWYALIANLPLIIIWRRITTGYPISRIQSWREHNKRFMQFAAGSALIVMASYLYTTQVIARIASAGGA